jgi:polar amino acid transport system permease protein
MNKSTEPTASGKRRPRLAGLPHVDVLQYLLVIAGFVWLIGRGTERLGYHWEWYRIPRYLFRSTDDGFVLGPLLQGLGVSFQIICVSLVLAFALGLSTALLRMAPSKIGRIFARGYLETIRNTPLLVQLFFIYFVIAPIFGIGAFASAVLALSLFEGAYASEVFRAGILSVPREQWEAARSIGLGPVLTYRLVVLPQAIRWMLPPLTSQAISLVKDSALVSTIAIYDLTMQGQTIIAETFLVFEVWFTVAAIYLVITLSLSLIVNVMENRLRLKT